MLSKSKYVLGKRCEKLLWLMCYKIEEMKEEDNSAVLENGNKVGDLARHILGNNYVLIDYNDNKRIMIDETAKYLKDKPNIICEASFEHDGNFCSVDILKNDLDGVTIYEVKSSTEVSTSYINDIAYQTWLLKKCGLKVKKSCLVYINSEYIKNGELDLNKLFIIRDVSKLINLDEVEKTVSLLKKTIKEKEEPNIDIGMKCRKNKDNPYECPFFEYCIRNLPSPNIFDVGWRVRFDKKLALYYQGITSYEDILKHGGLGPKADTQMKFALNNLEPKVNKKELDDFLSLLKYPLYFLDFESYQVAVPEIDGTKPYQQICFQYSLHYYLEENGELYHKEYLSDAYNGNAMYGLCKQLCEDIPQDSCVIAYHKSFECSRLREMAMLFPEFRDHLLNISNNIIDIEVPFANQDYYVKSMAGRSSIKVVLPALYPNDSTLDYHNLEQVHKGDEASNAYLSLANLSKEEQEELRRNMLKYCELDTYAMVKVYQKIKKITHR